MWLAPAVAVAGLVALTIWFLHGSGKPLALRVPGTDQAPGGSGPAGTNAVLSGKVVPGPGQPVDLPGSWPCFRGAGRDGISRDPTPLARSWAAGEPRPLWKIEVGEGYAGAAILNGRVYLMDYDREHKNDALRCLSLADGREIWRFAYPVSVKRNHGMSRTVPAVTDELAAAIGPKCHLAVIDARTGALKWGSDLARQFGTTIPPWYAGQCPLIESNRLIIAPAGEQVLMFAAEAGTGKILWQTPNPRGWKMTHASITPVEFGGRRMYVYCGHGGVVGVAADTGEILWDTTEWKISIATVASPLTLPGGRVFLSGGYNAGSRMLQIKEAGGKFTVETIFKLEADVFGATQQTPIFYNNHIYGVRPDGKFACLTPEGKPVWQSDPGQQFGLGPFMLADGLLLAVNDSGLLRLIEASPNKYTLLGQAQVLTGREAWGPLALAGGRLIARDLQQMVCLDLRRK